MLSRRDLKFLYKLFFSFPGKNKSRYKKEVKKVLVLFRVPLDSNKLNSWHDGFTEAISILSNSFEVDWWNECEKELTGDDAIKELNQYDFIIVKSVWRGEIDIALRKIGDKIEPPLGLMISGSKVRPINKELGFYDVIWYETNWYFDRVRRHPNAFHGFGIDRTIMIPDLQAEKKYDWILVGAPRKYKRVHKLLDKKGKKLFIGDLTNNDSYSRELLKLLEDNDIDVINFVEYSELSKYYNSSKSCYVPTKLHGGGERAVLEARSCGIKVEICDDNPKLKELLTCDIWDSNYYARQLEVGIRSIEVK